MTIKAPFGEYFWFFATILTKSKYIISHTVTPVETHSTMNITRGLAVFLFVIDESMIRYDLSCPILAVFTITSGVTVHRLYSELRL